MTMEEEWNEWVKDAVEIKNASNMKLILSKLDRLKRPLIFTRSINTEYKSRTIRSRRS